MGKMAERMLAMKSELVSVYCGGLGAMDDNGELDLDNIHYNEGNEVSPCAAYRILLDECDVNADVIIYVHDDVTLHDPFWHSKVMALFERPECVAVGLGGATALGSRDLYRKPFDIWAMARKGYASNQTDAEVHGARLVDARQVAVVDAFFMAVRVAWLRQIGGWPVGKLTHHCLDLWLACEAARTGRETWAVGVNCTHHGGRSSTTKGYAGAKWLQGGMMERDHILPHKWLYETYRDVLPLEVGQ